MSFFPSGRPASRPPESGSLQSPDAFAAGLNHEEMGFHPALALDVHHAARLVAVAIAERGAGCGRDLNAAGKGVRLHAACRVHCVAPDVIDELVGADHARDEWARMNTDARLQVKTGLRGDGIDRLEQAWRKRDDAQNMVRLRLGDAGRHHIGVADSLYLFHAVLEGKAVESGKYLAKELDGAVCRQFLA